MMAWLSALLLIVGTVALALGLMLLVRRTVRFSVLEEHQEVAGFIYAIIGVLYAVLLAFIVVVVWEQQAEARVRVEQEANELADLYRGTSAFPPAVRTRLRSDLHAYTESVLREEWPGMSAGRIDQETWRRYDALWLAYLELKPLTTYENAWYTQALERLNTLGDQRRLRLLSGRAHLPGAMWVVLWSGAVITISFAFFFGVRNRWAHALMISALSGSVALVLFLVAALDRPYTGVIQVGPEAFEQVLRILEHTGEPRR